MEPPVIHERGGVRNHEESVVFIAAYKFHRHF